MFENDFFAEDTAPREYGRRGARKASEGSRANDAITTLMLQVSACQTVTDARRMASKAIANANGVDARASGVWQMLCDAAAIARVWSIDVAHQTKADREHLDKLGLDRVPTPEQAEMLPRVRLRMVADALSLATGGSTEERQARVAREVARWQGITAAEAIVDGLTACYQAALNANTSKASKASKVQA